MTTVTVSYNNISLMNNANGDDHIHVGIPTTIFTNCMSLTGTSSVPNYRSFDFFDIKFDYYSCYSKNLDKHSQI